jgi:hypothetical protein
MAIGLGGVAEAMIGLKRAARIGPQPRNAGGRLARALTLSLIGAMLDLTLRYPFVCDIMVMRQAQGNR